MDTLRMQVGNVLTSEVTAGKYAGSTSLDVEAASLLENIAVRMTINPRSVIYLAHLARNALIKAATDEIAAIDALRSLIDDLGNQSFVVSSTSGLEKARIALIQMQSQSRVDTGSPAFQKFDSSISSFLEKQIKKNVYKKGSSEMSRPSDEASSLIPAAIATLSSRHSDSVDRLYSLVVGVTNFLSAPISGIFGVAASVRVSSDIQAIIESLGSDPSATSSREIASRLIASRAALKVIGTSPNIRAPVLSSAGKIPDGYEVTGYTPSVPATVTGGIPGVLPTDAGLTITVGGVTVSKSPLLQEGLDLAGKVLLVGNTVSSPLSIPPNSDLYITTKSSGLTATTRVTLNDTALPASRTVGDIVDLVNSAAVPGVSAAKLFGGDQILLYAPADSYESVSLSSKLVVNNQGLWSQDVPYVEYSNSAHAVLGFTEGQSSLLTSVPILAAEVINKEFSGVVTATFSGGMTVTSVSSGPGVSMSIRGTASEWLGISGDHVAGSSEFALRGSVGGVTTDPVNPVPIVSVGDLVSTPYGKTVVSAVSSTKVSVSPPVPLFSGNIVIDSPLVPMWDSLYGTVRAQTDVWLKSRYRKDISYLDQFLAPLSGSPTKAQRGQASSELLLLREMVSGLVAALSLPASSLPTGTGSAEKSVVQGIISSLRERKFDRAVAYFSKCRIREVFGMDWQSASFGGEALRSMSDFASNDLVFPNRANGDDSTVPSTGGT